jgi:hypothetical protein
MLWTLVGVTVGRCTRLQSFTMPEHCHPGLFHGMSTIRRLDLCAPERFETMSLINKIPGLERLCMTFPPGYQYHGVGSNPAPLRLASLMLLKLSMACHEMHMEASKYFGRSHLPRKCDLSFAGLFTEEHLAEMDIIFSRTTGRIQLSGGRLPLESRIFESAWSVQMDCGFSLRLFQMARIPSFIEVFLSAKLFLLLLRALCKSQHVYHTLLRNLGPGRFLWQPTAEDKLDANWDASVAEDVFKVLHDVQRRGVEIVDVRGKSYPIFEVGDVDDSGEMLVEAIDLTDLD